MVDGVGPGVSAGDTQLKLLFGKIKFFLFYSVLNAIVAELFTRISILVHTVPDFD